MMTSYTQNKCNESNEKAPLICNIIASGLGLAIKLFIIHDTRYATACTSRVVTINA